MVASSILHQLPLIAQRRERPQPATLLVTFLILLGITSQSKCTPRSKMVLPVTQQLIPQHIISSNINPELEVHHQPIYNTQSQEPKLKQSSLVN